MSTTVTPSTTTVKTDVPKVPNKNGKPKSKAKTKTKTKAKVKAIKPKKTPKGYLRILAVLCRSKHPLTCGEVASRAKLSSLGWTQLILGPATSTKANKNPRYAAVGNGMQAAGLVKRIDDEEDMAAQHVYHVTAKGRKLYQAR